MKAEPTKAYLEHAQAYARAMIERARRDEFCRRNPWFYRRCRHVALGEAREKEAGRG